MADQEPLDDDELEILREMIAREQALTTVAKYTRLILLWLAAVVGAIVFLGEHVSSWLKRMLGVE